MIIETKRLILRTYRDDDFEALREIICDPETMKYYPRPYDENGVRRWIAWCRQSLIDQGFSLFAAELKESGEFIGDCGISLQNIDGETLPEIGYHINKKYWRQGYAKEAATAVRDWFFEHTNYDAVYSYMNKENLPSRRTAEANGMTKIKEYTDPEESLAVYALTRAEWERKYR